LFELREYAPRSCGRSFSGGTRKKNIFSFDTSHVTNSVSPSHGGDPLECPPRHGQIKFRHYFARSFYRAQINNVLRSYIGTFIKAPRITVLKNQHDKLVTAAAARFKFDYGNPRRCNNVPFRLTCFTFICSKKSANNPV
jgi:hypothetical protein